MSIETSAWDQLSTDSAQLLLCDLQPQIVARSKTIEPDALGKSAILRTTTRPRRGSRPSAD
jgi:hypothetical protein